VSGFASLLPLWIKRSESGCLDRPRAIRSTAIELQKIRKTRNFSVLHDVGPLILKVLQEWLFDCPHGFFGAFAGASFPKPRPAGNMPNG
jgi:hypothetical protein